MNFEDMCGILHANYVSGARIEKFEIHGKGIAAYVDPPNKAEIFYDNRTDPELIMAKSLTGSEHVYRNYGFYSECKHFIESILEHKKPDTPIEDSVKIMEIIQWILEPDTDFA